jgi:hypothetical protein
MSEPDLPAGEFISFCQNVKLIFSNLSAAAAFLVTFCAVAKSNKRFWGEAPILLGTRYWLNNCLYLPH